MFNWKYVEMFREMIELGVYQELHDYMLACNIDKTHLGKFIDYVTILGTKMPEWNNPGLGPDNTQINQVIVDACSEFKKQYLEKSKDWEDTPY